MEHTTKTKSRWLGWMGLGWGGVLAMAMAVSVPASAAAQDPPEDCHCVDRDGNRIERCVCIKTFSPPDMQMFALTRKALVGVTIDYGQGPEADRQGVEIREVQPEGPASRAGLLAGDIVVRVDGKSVFDPLSPAVERTMDEDQSVPVQRFVRLVGNLEPDEPVEIEVLREGRARTSTVTPERAEGMFGSGLTLFGEPGHEFELRGLSPDSLRVTLRGRADDFPAQFRFFGDSTPGLTGERFFGRLRSDPCMDLAREDGRAQFWALGGNDCIAGVEFIELNPELGEYFGTSEGVLVSRVADESSLGLRPGDVLLAIDGREVRTPDHARRILESYEVGEETRLRVMRKGSETEVLARR